MASINLRNLSPEERLEFWRNHITKWKESNLSQAEYCRQNKLDKNLLTIWKKKLLSIVEKTTNNFVEVPVCKNSEKHIEIKIDDSLRIIIGNNYDTELLNKILKIAGA